MKTLELATAPRSLFWYWMNERHEIYLRRKTGQPKPWTDDPILRDYKFTNTFRQLDRGTVWLTENFLKPHEFPKHDSYCIVYDDAGSIEPDECDCGAYQEHLGLLAGNIAWYRMFNWTGTAEYLGWKTDWNASQVLFDLETRLARGEQVFTGAHIVYSTPGMSKLECITDVCDHLWKRRNDYARIARQTKSLRAVFEVLQEVDCVGGFMAYEMVSDMRHTRLLKDATDIMTWANPGPGAIRGLHRLEMPYKPRGSAIESMRMLCERVFHNETARDGFQITAFPPSVIEMRDIEHSLCEFDKYCRVKFGEGEPRSKFPGAA